MIFLWTLIFDDSFTLTVMVLLSTGFYLPCGIICYSSWVHNLGLLIKHSVQVWFIMINAKLKMSVYVLYNIACIFYVEGCISHLPCSQLIGVYMLLFGRELGSMMVQQTANDTVICIVPSPSMFVGIKRVQLNILLLSKWWRSESEGNYGFGGLELKSF